MAVRMKPARGIASWPGWRAVSVRSLLLVICTALLLFILHGGEQLGDVVTTFTGTQDIQGTSPSSHAIMLAQAERPAVPAPATDVDTSNDGTEHCLTHISYNKPVKTGSTSVTFAIRAYLQSIRQSDLGCGSEQCAPYAEKVCAGEAPLKHSIGHLHVNMSTIKCLREKGYYTVTSIRDPAERWTSSYLFNKQEKGSHHGISHELSYREFMEKFPACSLFYYYDRIDKNCDENMPLEELDRRINDIVSQFDEVLELGEPPVTDLHKRIVSLVGSQYVSKRDSSVDTSEIPEARIRNERRLYEAFKRKQLERPSKGRRLCQEFPWDDNFRVQNKVAKF